MEGWESALGSTSLAGESVSDVFGGFVEICAVFLGTEIDLLLQFIGLL